MKEAADTEMESLGNFRVAARVVKALEQMTS